MYNSSLYALPYFVEMTNNCLDVKAQFRYLNSELLRNIENGGILMASKSHSYKNQWAVYTGVSNTAKKTQKSSDHYLKQTNSGSLSLYKMHVCAKPSINAKRSYVLMVTGSPCRKKKQEFTFGKWNVCKIYICHVFKLFKFIYDYMARVKRAEAQICN